MSGAGSRNRTDALSLEDYCNTTLLNPLSGQTFARSVGVWKLCFGILSLRLSLVRIARIGPLGRKRFRRPNPHKGSRRLQLRG